MLIIWLIVLIISMFLLIKAAGYFTDSAEKIGVYFGMPAFIVGVTIVAIGTSLPELLTSILAVLRGSSEIVVGNVIGSNITNILLVLGVAIVFAKKTIKVGHTSFKIDSPILIASAILLFIMLWDRVFTLIEAIIFIICMILYWYYSYYMIKKHKDNILKKELRKEIKEVKSEIKKGSLGAKTWIILILSAALIYLGARFTVESVVNLSLLLGIGTEIIAASVVALGTSLPELTVSVMAMRKNKHEIALGNILGSNIFNTFAVMGIPALFGTLIIPLNMLSFGLPVMLIATLLYFFITNDRKIRKWEGWLLLAFYLIFLFKLFNLF
ncbi:MAG: calcium/sodium antiporter [Nanoarchaeota archaeon]|nr:calcium/sodium antiporter [Nanoarchaeota archaeon]